MGIIGGGYDGIVVHVVACGFLLLNNYSYM